MTYPGDPGYQPYEAPVEHPNTDLFRDIPLGGEIIHGTWVQTASGVLTMPHSASRLAEHVELCGYVLDPSRARIVHVGPTRGGAHLAAAGHWQDISKPIPEINKVAEMHAKAAELTPVELKQFVDAAQAQLDEIG